MRYYVTYYGGKVLWPKSGMCAYYRDHAGKRGGVPRGLRPKPVRRACPVPTGARRVRWGGAKLLRVRGILTSPTPPPAGKKKHEQGARFVGPFFEPRRGF